MSAHTGLAGTNQTLSSFRVMNMTTALAVALLSQNGHAMKASIHLTALELEKLDL